MLNAYFPNSTFSRFTNTLPVSILSAVCSLNLPNIALGTLLALPVACDIALKRNILGRGTRPPFRTSAVRQVSARTLSARSTLLSAMSLALCTCRGIAPRACALLRRALPVACGVALSSHILGRRTRPPLQA